MRTLLVSERERQGYTQQKLADAIGISRSHYADIERGRKDPSYKISVRIKRALGHPGDDIFFNQNDAKSGKEKRRKDIKREKGPNSG